ncbi:MAG: hypothetical protein QF406_02585 [Verrucomicrobiota bacterium]|jgi:hypothetical protein|nr:hypothetical protein [Verrucomicrobiota bacterium]
MSEAVTTTTQESEETANWRSIPQIAVVIGLVLCIYGLVQDKQQFAFSYLTAFMFCLSLGLGSLFLVLVHHLFDAGWSSPIRRYCEHLACLLFPWLGLAFIPIGFLGPEYIYPWMRIEDPHADHALHVKMALFNKPVWYAASVILFLLWGWLTHRLRYWSLQQDKSGTPDFEGKLLFPEHLMVGFYRKFQGLPYEKDQQQVVCTRMMRIHSAYGILLFAFTLTLGAILWMKSIQHQFFSTMYGVYYFAGSLWMSISVAWIIGRILKAKNIIPQLHTLQFYNLGTMLLAFTVFYAYIHFSQYFLIWNAAVPEETFWYVLREKGSWAYVSWALIIGHFLIPFLALLRIDVKLTNRVMVPIFVWVLLMHYMDMYFNVMPEIHETGPSPALADLGSLLLLGGALIWVFMRNLFSHPVILMKDPRMGEALERH